MSVLFGAQGLAGALSHQGSADLMRAMGQRAAASVGAAHAVQALSDDGCAVALCARPRDRAADVSPFARRGPLTLALRGRVDERAALLRRLGLAADAPLSDAQLLLATWEQQGPDFFQQLGGDWTLALWDAGRQRLTLARDATGNSPLFWWQGGGRIVFATSLPTLLAAPGVPSRPDARWLAGLLAVFHDPEHPGTTAFESVRSLPPGHLLVATAGGTEVRRWWWPENLPPLDPAPVEELHERFRALYDDAVRRCLQRDGGSVAITLSGGLDSGSVAALAAPALAEQGQRLSAFVHTPRFASRDGAQQRTLDEWPLALATARFVGHTDAHACPSEQSSPMDGLQRWLDMAATPSHAAVNWYWLLDIAQQAAACGASVLLTGQAGNSTVSFNGTGDLRPLLRSAGMAAVLRELAAEQGGWACAVRDRLFKPALRPAWHAWRRARAAQRPQPGWHDLALLQPSLADQVGLAAAMRRAGHDPSLTTFSPRVQRQFRLSLMDGTDLGMAAWGELSAAHGLWIRDPTRDRRLVEFCCRLPDEVFWAHGRCRGLVRGAMADRLPPEVLNCQRKGLQSSDLRERLQQCREDLLASVDQVCRHPLARDWLDTDRLALSARAAADPGQPAGAVHFGHMLRALAVGLFITRHV